MNNIPAYKTELVYSDTRKIQYLFESKGEKSIIKAIEYTPVAKRDGKVIYNLGFGDYNEEDGNILDDANSNNGDMRRVFSTVLNTIPKFSKKMRMLLFGFKEVIVLMILSEFVKLTAKKIAMICVKTLTDELKLTGTMLTEISQN